MYAIFPQYKLPFVNGLTFGFFIPPSTLDERIHVRKQLRAKRENNNQNKRRCDFLLWGKKKTLAFSSAKVDLTSYGMGGLTSGGGATYLTVRASCSKCVIRKSLVSPFDRGYISSKHSYRPGQLRMATTYTTPDQLIIPHPAKETKPPKSRWRKITLIVERNNNNQTKLGQ